jgi:hypothetical protein
VYRDNTCWILQFQDSVGYKCRMGIFLMRGRDAFFCEGAYFVWHSLMMTFFFLGPQVGRSKFYHLYVVWDGKVDCLGIHANGFVR